MEQSGTISVLYYNTHNKSCAQISNHLLKQHKAKYFLCVCATGIVYVFSQKEAESVSSELQKRDIVAYPYHANMDPDSKSRVHRKWAANKIKVFLTFRGIF